MSDFVGYPPDDETEAARRISRDLANGTYKVSLVSNWSKNNRGSWVLLRAKLDAPGHPTFDGAHDITIAPRSSKG